MFLIMSADYISPELRSEFGGLPPSFLPLGNRRLFQHQVKSAPGQSQVYLSLPESFTVGDRDRLWLERHSVTLLSIPDGLSLGASLVAALNLADSAHDSPLHVLFGDTLITPLPPGDNIVATAQVEDNYNWAVVTDDDDNWLVSSNDALAFQDHSVVTGYFKFSNPRQLIRCITQCNWNFLQGLARYRNAVGLSTVKVSNWLDFGHANSYYHSKSTFTTQRMFNELRITPGWIEKSSENDRKIEGEARWFESLPPMMRQYTPQYLGSPDKGGHSFTYRLEYLHHTALNELYVFADIPPLLWRKILQKCLTFLGDCRSYPAPEGQPSTSLADLFNTKTGERLNTFCQERGISKDKVWHYGPDSAPSLALSIADLERESGCRLPSVATQHCLMHGDFCFSNILYDFRTNRIKVIDPRGITLDGELSSYGDTRYDLAKLSHSILGLYDWIIAGYHTTTISGDRIRIELPDHKRQRDVQQHFLEMVEEQFSLTPVELYAMQIQLFLSMLPLHADDPDRQDALLANAFRLYELMIRHQQ
ncbi:phosphotransferase [Marinobacter mobilis]|uniref:Aminoglycoside phosphotransferase domain-containing protein n=1 Tax=Marinobacter mobilis TaxID=488533 RepID=A0A1H3AZR4_9GAMM|nr:phosphotransferase [Marinobacter mobilis]SDX34309.1 hypothetical protein SAMN04487960_108135 [Marinobacter mobilis]